MLNKEVLGKEALDKEYNRVIRNHILRLAIPLGLQQLINSSLGLVDTLIVGGLGENFMAASTIVNQYYFIFFLVQYGIHSGASIFFAQYWGKKDIANIKRVLGVSLTLSVFASILFTVAAYVVPETIMGIFTNDEVLMKEGTAFLKIIGIANLFSTITQAYSFMLKSANFVRLATTISVIALLLNTILTYLMVYGKLGFPRLALTGAGIATAIARLVELSILMYFVYFKKHILAGKPKEIFDINWEFIKKYLKKASPVILNEILWSIGISMYYTVYGRMGTEALVVITIVATIDRVFFAAYVGFADACAIIIGNKIGGGAIDEAYYIGKKALKMVGSIGLILGSIILMIAKPVVGLYNISENVAHLAYTTLIVLSCLNWIKALNFGIIIGILRSGGDIRFSLVLDILVMWVIGVPLVYVAGLVLGLPIYVVYGFVFIEEIVKVSIGLWRFKTKKWIHNVIVDKDTVEVA